MGTLEYVLIITDSTVGSIDICKCYFNVFKYQDELFMICFN